jgi:hypothetical protein
MDSFMKADIYANYSPYYSSEAYDSDSEHLSLQRHESDYVSCLEQEKPVEEIFDASSYSCASSSHHHLSSA